MIDVFMNTITLISYEFFASIFIVSYYKLCNIKS